MRMKRAEFALTYIVLPMAAVGLLFVLNPTKTTWLPKCPFHLLTGLYCPGCGMTRALHQLVTGHIFAAVAMNPLVIFLAPFLAYSLICEASKTLGRPIRQPRVFPQLYWALAAGVILFGIARNLPWHPFNLLAPH